MANGGSTIDGGSKPLSAQQLSSNSETKPQLTPAQTQHLNQEITKTKAELDNFEALCSPSKKDSVRAQDLRFELTELNRKLNEFSIQDPEIRNNVQALLQRADVLGLALLTKGEMLGNIEAGWFSGVKEAVNTVTSPVISPLVDALLVSLPGHFNQTLTHGALEEIRSSANILLNQCVQDPSYEGHLKAVSVAIGNFEQVRAEGRVFNAVEEALYQRLVYARDTYQGLKKPAE